MELPYGSVWKLGKGTLDLCGDLGERVRSGKRVERLRTTPDQPNTFRCSHGPRWALAGDAGGGLVMDGQFPAYDGVDAMYSPRRTLLDSILVEAAREAGAEVRENFRVTQLTASGNRITGITGSARGRPAVTETADLVIGADGKRSLVADAVGARRYRERPVRSFASYSYWTGVPVSGGEIYQRTGRAVAVFPTNGELTMVYVAAPITRSTCAAIWASASAAARGWSGCAPRLTSPTRSGARTGPGGRWPGTPASSWTRSRRRA